MTLQTLVLLLVAGPGLLAAQRFEVAFLGGTSRPAGSVQQESGDVCDEPCPIAYRPVALRSGGMVGARWSLVLPNRWSVDVTLQRVRVPEQRVAGTYAANEDVTTTTVSVLPHVRVRLNDVLEFRAGAGTVASRLRVVSTWGASPQEKAGWRGGIAASAGLRANARPFFVDLRATSFSYYLNANPDISDRRDVTFSLGLGFAFALDPETP